MSITTQAFNLSPLVRFIVSINTEALISRPFFSLNFFVDRGEKESLLWHQDKSERKKKEKVNLIFFQLHANCQKLPSWQYLIGQLEKK